MLRFRLRTLLVLLALLPPLLWVGWGKYQAWRAERELQRLFRTAKQRAHVVRPVWVHIVLTNEDFQTEPPDSSDLEPGKGP